MSIGAHDNTTTEDIINDNAVQVVFFIVYTSIFVLGIFGNVLVCYVVFRNKAMQTVTNVFITNLALSDILLCVLAVLSTPLYTFLGEWVFGSVICHLVNYTQCISVFVSTLTLTSIAIDRYFVIIYPLKTRMKLATCIRIIIVIWIFSMVVTLPLCIYTKLIADPSHNFNKYFCDERWPSEQWRRTYSGIITVMQFLIPFLIIAFCYICISLKLNDRARSRPGSQSNREKKDRKRKKRTDRMLLAMVVVFLISWLPLNVLNIVNDFYLQVDLWPFYYLTFCITHAIAMSSTCYNPFLYAWLNENFRKEFKQVLPCFVGPAGRMPQTNRFVTENWHSRRNETKHESLLRSSGSLSSRECRLTPSPPAKTDDIEMAPIGVPVASYGPASDAVRLNLVSEEEPPPYEKLAATE